MNTSDQLDRRMAVSPPSLCPPPEPYSYGIKVGTTLHLSGQVALDPSGVIVGSTVGEQAEQVWENILAVLEEAGGSAVDIVKVLYYLADIRDFDQEMVVRRRVFEGLVLPAVTGIQVAALGLPGLLLEVDVTAELAQ
ncbi:MAG: RidA family protein [bacterium]|jgi:enamine deaminase RidA (YjgF/YER057c/UK114 family)